MDNLRFKERPKADRSDPDARGSDDDYGHFPFGDDFGGKKSRVETGNAGHDGYTVIDRARSGFTGARRIGLTDPVRGTARYYGED